MANAPEGSVRKSGNRLRVTAQLVSAQDGYQLWSQSFDSELADVFAVQDQIASAVVTALKLKVLPNASSKGGRKTTTPEAYTHFLQGRALKNSGSTPSMRQAIEEFEKALELDLNFAPPTRHSPWRRRRMAIRATTNSRHALGRAARSRRPTGPSSWTRTVSMSWSHAGRCEPPSAGTGRGKRRL